MTRDIQLIQALIDRAKREGSAYLFVPVRLAQALVETASKPAVAGEPLKPDLGPTGVNPDPSAG